MEAVQGRGEKSQICIPLVFQDALEEPVKKGKLEKELQEVGKENRGVKIDRIQRPGQPVVKGV